MNVADTLLGGAKKKNGHKQNCHCHICENIKNKAKNGGYLEDAEKALSGGSKKKNGHKDKCNCPICKNMKNAKKRNKSGGYLNRVKPPNEEPEEPEDEPEEPEEEPEEPEEEPEEPEEEPDEADGQMGGKRTRKRRHTNGHKSTCKCPICKNMKKKKKTSKNNRMLGFNLGGTRKRRHTNGHKRACKCPICKNMKKKTHRRH